MKPINISSLIKKYGPGYIAKSKKTGQVIAHVAFFVGAIGWLEAILN